VSDRKTKVVNREPNAWGGTQKTRGGVKIIGKNRGNQPTGGGNTAHDEGGKSKTRPENSECSHKRVAEKKTTPVLDLTGRKMGGNFFTLAQFFARRFHGW